MNLVKAIAMSGTATSRALQLLPPEQRPATLSATIMNIIGNMSEEEWNEIKDNAGRPCGEPGCECHTYVKDLLVVLEPFRKKWDQVTERKRAKTEEGGFAV